MNQYVNTEPFFQWYSSVTKEKSFSREQVLQQVFLQFSQTRREEFELPAAQTKSGRPERYPFRFEHLNCCGADRIIISFSNPE